MVLTDDSNMSFSAFQNFLNDPNRNMQNRPDRPGPYIGGPRQMDFRDRNFNGIDDRDEPGGSHYNPNNPKKPIGSKPKPQSKTKPVDKPKVETKPKAQPKSKPSTEERAKRTASKKRLQNRMKDF